MKKEEFLRRLKASLSRRKLPEDEINQQLSNYDELISDMTEDDMSEEDAIQKLGMPELLTDEIAAAYYQEHPQLAVPKRKLPVWLIVLLIVGSPVWLPIGLGLAVTVLSLYLTVWILIAALWICTASMAIALVGGIAESLILLQSDPMQALMLFGCSLACGGIGVFLFHLSLLCTKSFAKLTLLMLPKKWREKHAMKHPEKPQPKAVPEGGAAL